MTDDSRRGSNAFALVATVALLVLPTHAFAVQWTKSTEGDNGTYRRFGNVLEYSWVHKDARRGDLEMYLSFTASDFDAMQTAYRQASHGIDRYGRFVFQDPFASSLPVVAGELQGLASANGVLVADLALSFVQSLKYDDDNHGYQRYAVETLLDGTGDCSDTAVLLSGLFEALGFRWTFLEFPNHLAVGLAGDPSVPGQYYALHGFRYFYCESTGSGYAVGEAPSDYAQRSARVLEPWDRV